MCKTFNRNVQYQAGINHLSTICKLGFHPAELMGEIARPQTYRQEDEITGASAVTYFANLGHPGKAYKALTGYIRNHATQNQHICSPIL